MILLWISSSLIDITAFSAATKRSEVVLLTDLQLQLQLFVAYFDSFYSVGPAAFFHILFIHNRLTLAVHWEVSLLFGMTLHSSVNANEQLSNNWFTLNVASTYH